MDNILPLKVFCAGSGGIGKTTMIIQFIVGTFIQEYDCYWDDSFRKQCQIDGETMVFDVYDDIHHDEYRELYEATVRQADVILLGYSITSRRTFEELKDWIERFQKIKGPGNFPMVIVGNKCDLEDERQVTPQEAKEFALQHKSPFFEVSARARVNIEEAFFETYRVFRHCSSSVDDLRTKRSIPALPGHLTARPSTMRDNFATMVNQTKFHDVVLVSDEWTKFKLFSIAIQKNGNFWLPPEVWKILIQFFRLSRSFSKRYKIPAHRCILLSRFPTLMEFFKENSLHLDLPQNYDTDGLIAVVKWLYSGHCPDHSDNLAKMLPIATKLKLYNLVSICQGKSQSQPSNTFSVDVLFNSEAFSDCTLHCNDGTKILGHRAILYSRSSYFRQLINRLSDTQYKIDGSGPANLALVRHLYDDRPVEDMLLREVTILCANRQDMHLSERFQCQILASLNYNNIVQIYDWGSLSPSLPVIQQGLKHWIGYRVALLKKSPLWAGLPKQTQDHWEAMRKYGNWVEAGDQKEKCIIA